jgi:hypothetical protein
MAKIDLVERPTNDDRMVGNGFGTPNFLTLKLIFEFSHNLQRKRASASGSFLETQLHRVEYQSAVGHGGLLAGPNYRIKARP